MDGPAQRLEVLKRFLAHARERLGIDVGFVLWDGSTVPPGLGPDRFAIAIADEGAVAALMRRPKLDTILNLWVSARLDLLPESYRRYLVNGIRRELGFEAVPIRLTLRSPKNPFATK